MDRSFRGERLILTQLKGIVLECRGVSIITQLQLIIPEDPESQKSRLVMENLHPDHPFFMGKGNERPLLVNNCYLIKADGSLLSWVGL